jgi:hypothetical protein
MAAKRKASAMLHKVNFIERKNSLFQVGKKQEENVFL